VFVSSHLLSELAMTAPARGRHRRGRLIADTTVAELIAGATRDSVRVRTTDPDALTTLLLSHGATISRGDNGAVG